MKVYLTQCKNGIMMHVEVSTKNCSCKSDYMWNPRTCDCERKKACKIDKFLDIKFVYVKNVFLAN